MCIFCRSLFIILFFTFFSLLVLSSRTFAGTTQIVSPAGLPRSNNQNTFTPSIGDSNSAAYTTPPLPLQGSAMESLSMPSLPLHGNTDQNITNPGASTTPIQNAPESPSSSVSSFFQLSPQSDLPISQNNTNQNRSSKIKEKPLPIDVEKGIWHVLDNLGIPMFIGKDNDLDPSLNPNNMASPLDQFKQKVIDLTPHKIPESELEGIEVAPSSDKKISVPQ